MYHVGAAFAPTRHCEHRIEDGQAGLGEKCREWAGLDRGVQPQKLVFVRGDMPSDHCEGVGIRVCNDRADNMAPAKRTTKRESLQPTATK